MTSPEKVEELARRMAREAFQARLIDAGPVEVEYMRPYAVLLLEATRVASRLMEQAPVGESLSGVWCSDCVGGASKRVDLIQHRDYCDWGALRSLLSRLESL